MNFIDNTDNLQGDTTTTRYIPIDKIMDMRWVDNPKLHDLQAIWQSIERNGFRDRPAWDSNLTPVEGEHGSGAILFGNGRIEALHWGWKNQQDKPQGILEDDKGLWYVPVEFGLDSASEVQAQAFGIDHNSLTMSGGDFEASDIWRMYDREVLAELGERIASSDNGVEPITLDGDSLGALQRYINAAEQSEDGYFDASKLPDVVAGNIKQSYVVYISVPDYELFREVLLLLTLGKRDIGEDTQGHTMSAFDSVDFIAQWRELLGGEE